MTLEEKDARDTQIVASLKLILGDLTQEEVAPLVGRALGLTALTHWEATNLQNVVAGAERSTTLARGALDDLQRHATNIQIQLSNIKFAKP